MLRDICKLYRCRLTLYHKTVERFLQRGRESSRWLHGLRHRADRSVAEAAASMAPSLLSCLQKTVGKQEKGLAVALYIILKTTRDLLDPGNWSAGVWQEQPHQTVTGVGTLPEESTVKRGPSEDISHLKVLVLSPVCGA